MLNSNSTMSEPTSQACGGATDAQKAALREAAAAKACDAPAMVAALYRSHVRDGIARTMADRWSRFSANDVNEIIAYAVTALSVKVSGGAPVNYPAAFLSRTAHNMACGLNTACRQTLVTDPAIVERGLNREAVSGADGVEPTAEPDEPDREELLRHGIVGRRNFGGVHRSRTRHAVTKLELVLTGWDEVKGKITQVDGGIELRDPEGLVAARWSFEALLNHWKRKHAKAVYVPSLCSLEPRRYRFGSKSWSARERTFHFCWMRLAKVRRSTIQASSSRTLRESRH